MSGQRGMKVIEKALRLGESFVNFVHLNEDFDILYPEDIAMAVIFHPMVKKLKSIKWT
jgi:hypothetical protein